MELNPTLVIFLVLMLLSGLRAVFEFLGKIAVEAERAAKRAQEEERRRQARQRAGMPGAPTQPQAGPSQPQSGPALVETPAPRPPEPQPILLEELLRQMMGEPSRPAPRPMPAPAPRPAPQPAVVAADDDRPQFDVDHLDTSHLQEREGRIKSRLNTKIGERVLASGLKPDDQIELPQAQAAPLGVLAELERRATPLQRAVIYGELFGAPRALAGPLRRAPTRRV